MREFAIDLFGNNTSQSYSGCPKVVRPLSPQDPAVSIDRVRVTAFAWVLAASGASRA